MILYSLQEVLRRGEGDLSDCKNKEAEVAGRVASWVTTYLVSPHAQLGRAGVVCPWVPVSIQEGLFWLALLRTRASAAQIDTALLELRDIWLKSEPTMAPYASFKTIVIAFPDLSPEEAPQFIDDLHQRMKPQFVDHGLMLGEFYSSCQKPGLRNRNFRPLQAPVPLIVIRDMVLIDIAFLCDNREFALAYVKKHGTAGLVEILRLLGSQELHSVNKNAQLLREVIDTLGPTVTAEENKKKAPDRDSKTSRS